MARPLLSACLIVRNEERHLPRCLASLDGLADEVIVHDTGSTDCTVEVARDFGAHVFVEDWAASFAYHCNRAMAASAGTWLLNIDADEEVVETEVESTRQRLARGTTLPDVLLVRSELHYPDGKQLVVQPRIVRSSAGIRFIHDVHEQLDVHDEPAALSSITLRHHGYMDRHELRRKEERNLALAQEMTDSAHRQHCLARSSFSLGRWSGVVEAARTLLEADAGRAYRFWLVHRQVPLRNGSPRTRGSVMCSFDTSGQRSSKPEML